MIRTRVFRRGLERRRRARGGSVDAGDLIREVIRAPICRAGDIILDGRGLAALTQGLLSRSCNLVPERGLSRFRELGLARSAAVMVVFKIELALSIGRTLGVLRRFVVMDAFDDQIVRCHATMRKDAVVSQVSS